MSRLQELIDELCPDGMVFERFDSVCILKARIGWQRLTKAERLPVGDYLLITGTDFQSNHKINYSTCEYVTKERYEQDENIQLCDGDVLLTKDGTLGKVVIVEGLPKPATLNSHLFVVRSKTARLEQRFIMYYLLSYGFTSAMEANSAGSTIKGFTQKAFSSIKIPVPPIEIQREIVRILDSFQELDDALTAEIEARKKQFEACLSKLMKVVSESASMVKLGSQMTIVRGASPRPIKRYLTTDVDGVHWIKIGDVGVGGKYVTDTAEYVTPDGAAKSRFLKRGSLILSNSMSFGRPYILDIDGCIHDGWLAMSDYESSYDRDFLYYLLRSEGVQKAWNMAASTSTVRNLNADIVRDTLVPLPRMDEQIEAVRTLDEIMKLNDLLRSERDARRKQFEHYRDRLLAFPEKAA